MTEKKNDDHKLAQEEVQAGKEETSVTVEEVTRTSGLRGAGNIFSALWKRPFIILALLIVTIVGVLPLATYFFLSGSTFTENKGAFLQRVQDLNELATAEAYTKVIIERQDNEIFGKSIGLNLPGTKRQLLVVIPGSVKAGVELSGLTEKDIIVDEEKKTMELKLPRATFIGGAEIYFDEVEVFSYEGLFREKANIEEAYELAEEAKQLILKESTEQGLLLTAEKNAEKALKEMFSFAGYDVTIQFKE